MFLLPPLKPKLSAALRDVTSESPRARAAAAESLGGAPDGRGDEARKALRPLIDDTVGSVRAAAIESLGRLKDREALDDIVGRFEDQDPTVRQIALMAAAEIGDRRVLPALERALRSDEPDVRFQAVASLTVVAGEGAIGVLRRVVTDDDIEVRAHLADSLGSLETPEARAPLRKLLDDDELLVRKAAAIGLARCGDDSGARVLVEALTDKDRCFEAAWALGELKVELACEPLARMTRAVFKPLAIKAAAAAALVRIGDPRGEPALLSVLTALRSDARGYAAQMVGELELVSLAPEVAKLADQPRGADPMVVAEALGRLAALSDVAMSALEDIAGRRDEVGERARELLEGL